MIRCDCHKPRHNVHLHCLRALLTDIAKLFMEMDAAAPKQAKGEIPLKLVGRSGELVENLYYAVGKDAKKFDAVVKQLEGFVKVVQQSGLVVERFFTTTNYSEEECKMVMDLLLTDKEPLKSFDSIKNAEVREMIVDNEGNLDTWRDARKGIAALALTPEVRSALESLAAAARLDLVKKTAAKAATLRAVTSKTLDAEVRSAVPLSKEQQAAIVKALPQYVPAGQSVNVAYEVDPAVLGGLMVTIGNTTIDLSATSKIVELAQRKL